MSDIEWGREKESSVGSKPSIPRTQSQKVSSRIRSFRGQTQDLIGICDISGPKMSQMRL